MLNTTDVNLGGLTEAVDTLQQASHWLVSSLSVRVAQTLDPQHSWAGFGKCDPPLPLATVSCQVEFVTPCLCCVEIVQTVLERECVCPASTCWTALAPCFDTVSSRVQSSIQVTGQLNIETRIEGLIKEVEVGKRIRKHEVSHPYV